MLPEVVLSAALTVQSDINNLVVLRRHIRERGSALGFDDATVADMVSAVDEAATNIIVHGYKHEPGPIELEIKSDEGALVAHLRDEAPAFDPTTIPTPDISIPIHQRPLGGMGIHVIRQAVDVFTHQPRPGGGNILTFRIEG